MRNIKGQFIYQGKKEVIKCLYCGKVKKVSTYYHRKFCSLECSQKYKIGIKRPTHSKWMKEAFQKGIMKMPNNLFYHPDKKEKKKISIRMKKRWKDKNDYFNSDKYRQFLSDQVMLKRKKGTFNNSGHLSNRGWWRIKRKKYYFKSSWEVIYARYLEWLKEKKEIRKWEYEPNTFWFEKIKRGVRSYLPDFKIMNNDNSVEYHEVKGWMDTKSKTKIKRMKKYFPEIILKIIMKNEINEIKKFERMFPKSIKVVEVKNN